MREEIQMKQMKMKYRNLKDQRTTSNYPAPKSTEKTGKLMTHNLTAALINVHNVMCIIQPKVCGHLFTVHNAMYIA